MFESETVCIVKGGYVYERVCRLCNTHFHQADGHVCLLPRLRMFQQDLNVRYTLARSDEEKRSIDATLRIFNQYFRDVVGDEKDKR